MEKENYLKALPKVEVSFQDDFSGSETELYLTPKYILRKLEELKIIPSVGQEILVWEKDVQDNGDEYYMCNIATFVEANPETLQEYESYGHEIISRHLTRLNGIKVLAKLSQKGYFDLPLDSAIFTPLP